MVNLNSLNNWRTHQASAAQIQMIRRNGWDKGLDIDLRNMTKGEACDLIAHHKGGADDLSKGPLMATEAQRGLIRRLCEERDLEITKHCPDDLTRKAATTVITTLKDIRVVTSELEIGLYMRDDKVYRVKENANGFLYARVMEKLPAPEYVSNGIRHYHFVREIRALARLRPEHIMTKAQVKAFGLDTGSCCRCGLALDPNIKNPDGSDRWIGPECQKKMGW